MAWSDLDLFLVLYPHPHQHHYSLPFKCPFPIRANQDQTSQWMRGSTPERAQMTLLERWSENWYNWRWRLWQRRWLTQMISQIYDSEYAFCQSQRGLQMQNAKLRMTRVLVAFSRWTLVYSGPKIRTARHTKDPGCPFKCFDKHLFTFSRLKRIQAMMRE